ncbi:hypothetical protein BH09VER1_BH09VER1_35280 [soil metagenome]
MPTRVLSILALFIVFATSASAQLSDVQISAARKKLDETKSHANSATVTTKEIAYKITVESHTSKVVPDLQIKYMIFYFDAQSGSKEKPLETSQKGTLTVASLPANQSVTIETEPFKLTTEELDGNVVFMNGASSRAADRVSGIWIRAYSGGKIIGEYSNPTTISKRNTWKE